MNRSTVSALQAGDNIISFSSAVPQQTREDIADMLMYADFFASQTFRKQEQWTSWIEYYREQLTKPGCRVVSRIIKEPMVITEVQELNDFYFEVAGSVDASQLKNLVLRSLKFTGFYEYARSYLQYGSARGGFTSFQVVPCDTSAIIGEVRFMLCALHASANVDASDHGVRRDMVVRLAGGVYIFDREAYAGHRERISDRLQQVGRYNIRQIVI